MANVNNQQSLEQLPSVHVYKYKIEQTRKSDAEKARAYRLRHKDDPEYRQRKREQDRLYLQKNQDRRLKYKGKHYMIAKPRTGVCNLCRAVKGVDCKQTQWHHITYDDTHKELHTIELCARCHNLTTKEIMGGERLREAGRRLAKSLTREQRSAAGKKSVQRRIQREGKEHYMDRLNARGGIQR